MKVVFPLEQDLISIVSNLPHILQNTVPDVILLDLMIPSKPGGLPSDLAGIDFLRMVREGHDMLKGLIKENTPIIVLSGYEGITNLEEKYRNEVSKIFSKPVSTKVLVSAIDKVIAEGWG